MIFNNLNVIAHFIFEYENKVDSNKLLSITVLVKITVPLYRICNNVFYLDECQPTTTRLPEHHFRSFLLNYKTAIYDNMFNESVYFITEGVKQTSQLGISDLRCNLGCNKVRNCNLHLFLYFNILQKRRKNVDDFKNIKTESCVNCIMFEY